MAPMRMRASRPRQQGAASRLAHAGLNRAASSLAAVALGFCSTAGAADWTFSPRVLLGQLYLDNVRLAPDGFEQSEWITELKPGFTLTGESSRSRLEIDYDLQRLWFWDDSQFNDTFHQLDGSGTLVLVPQNFFIDGFARFNQNTIDTRDRITFGNYAFNDNRTDVLAFGASPYHEARLGNWAESLVAYQYSGVRYPNAGADDADFLLEDSDTQTVWAKLGSPAAARDLSWSMGGMRTVTEFDEADDFKYDQVELELGVPVSQRLRLTGTVGRESAVDEDSTQGGLDASLWSAGFQWEPSALQSLEARAGRRFYGTAYEANWRRRGSNGEFRLIYLEQPTTSSGLLGGFGGIGPGTQPGNIGNLDTRVFVLKRLTASASYQLTRSFFDLQVYSDRREFQDEEGGTEESRGAVLSYSWDVLVRTRFGASAKWEVQEFEGGESDIGDFSVSVTRDISRTLSGGVRATHLLQNSDQFDDWRANLVSIFVEAQF